MAAKTNHEPGEILVFKAYADAEGSSDGTLRPGDRVVVLGLAQDEGVHVRPIGEDGQPVAHGRSDETLYPEEIAEDGEEIVRDEPVSKAEVDGGEGESAPDSPDAIAAQAAVHEMRPVPRLVSDIIAEGEDAVDAAKRLSQKVQEDFFALGELLHFIKSNNIHAQRGYDGKRGWQDFVVQELHEIDYRKAQYLISIYTSLSSVGIGGQVLSELGWSKTKEIARIVRRRNESGERIGAEILARDVKHLIATAKKMSRDDFTAYVSKNYMKAIEAPKAPPKDTEAPRRVSYRWSESDRAEVADAIKLVRVHNNNFHSELDDAAALRTIVSRWRELEEETLEQAVARLQERFKVTILAE